MKRRGFLAGLAASVAALFASRANGTQKPRLVTDLDGLRAIEFDGTSHALECDPEMPKRCDPYPDVVTSSHAVVYVTSMVPMRYENAHLIPRGIITFTGEKK